MCRGIRSSPTGAPSPWYSSLGSEQQGSGRVIFFLPWFGESTFCSPRLPTRGALLLMVSLLKKGCMQKTTKVQVNILMFVQVHNQSEICRTNTFRGWLYFNLAQAKAYHMPAAVATPNHVHLRVAPPARTFSLVGSQSILPYPLILLPIHPLSFPPLMVISQGIASLSSVFFLLDPRFICSYLQERPWHATWAMAYFGYEVKSNYTCTVLYCTVPRF